MNKTNKDMAAYNYYKDELSKIKLDSEYHASIKIKGAEQGATKNLALNKESATILVAWLKKNFINS